MMPLCSPVITLQGDLTHLFLGFMFDEILLTILCALLIKIPKYNLVDDWMYYDCLHEILPDN